MTLPRSDSWSLTTCAIRSSSASKHMAGPWLGFGFGFGFGLGVEAHGGALAAVGKLVHTQVDREESTHLLSDCGGQ